MSNSKIRIVVVEDEVKTLQGIGKLIRKMGEEYQLAGSAQNGREGVALILKEKPDIVITDVQMPELSGLEMIRRIGENGLSCKYLILSGFADFEYAREALKLGSIDYLLKPVTKDKLFQVLEQAKEMIRLEQQQIPLTFLAPEVLFEKMILNQGEASREYCKELCKRGENKKDFLLVYLKCETSLVSREKEKLHRLIEDCLKDIGRYQYYSDVQKEGWMLLWDASYLNMEQKLQAIQQEQIKQIHAEIIYAVIEFQNMEKLEDYMLQVKEYVLWNLSLQDQQIITEQLIKSLVCNTFVYPVGIEREIVNKINAGDMEGMEEKLEQFVDYLKSQTYRYSDIREALMCLSVAVLYSIRKASYGIYKEISHLNILDWAGSRLSVSTYTTMMMNILMQFKRYNENTCHSTNLVINKTLQIIHNEFKKDINLEDVARRLNITPEYLSSLFIKEIGVKFTSYCTQKRIESAKIMLQNGANKIYEVAEQNGYADVRYFCKVFKKYTGINPSEYIRQDIEKEE